MKLRKTVSERGEVKIAVTIDNNWRENPSCCSSRKITGTDREERLSGVFAISKIGNFYYGEYSKTFYFSEELPESLEAAEYARVLQKRIETIRAWVAECKSRACVTEVEITTTDQVVKRLKDENRLLYRNKKGQIKTLDI